MRRGGAHKVHKPFFEKHAVKPTRLYHDAELAGWGWHSKKGKKRLIVR